MEHGFPPPFRWEYVTTGEIVALTVAALCPVGVVVGMVVSARRPPSRSLTIKWVGGLLVCSVAWLFLSSTFIGNWRHDAVISPYLSRLSLSALILSFFAVLWSEVRLPVMEWRVGKVGGGLGCGFLLLLFISAPLLSPCGGRAGRGWLRSECKHRLKQIGLALHNYHDNWDEFPTVADSGPAVSWRVALLPYVDEEGLAKKYVPTAAWSAEENLPVARSQVYSYVCPSRHRRGESVDSQQRYFTDYVTLVGNGTLSLHGRPQRFSDITDGTANTLAVVEATGLNIVWTEPRDAELDQHPLGINLAGDDTADSRGVASAWHPGGVHALLADGSVKFLNEDTDPNVLRALSTVAGGEEVGDY